MRCREPAEAALCGDCGTALAASNANAPSGSSGAATIAIPAEMTHAADGERKTVTALFVEIKGSTELMEGLDPEEAQRIVDPALKIMIEAVRDAI